MFWKYKIFYYRVFGHPQIGGTSLLPRFTIVHSRYHTSVGPQAGIHSLPSCLPLQCLVMFTLEHPPFHSFQFYTFATLSQAHTLAMAPRREAPAQQRAIDCKRGEHTRALDMRTRGTQISPVPKQEHQGRAEERQERQGEQAPRKRPPSIRQQARDKAPRQRRRPAVNGRGRYGGARSHVVLHRPPCQGRKFQEAERSI